MRVLLVEDDLAIVAALSNLLANEGFDVDTASRQDDAITCLSGNLYDLVLLDTALKQGTGFAVCVAAREAAPKTPVIFLTASDDEYNTVAGLDMRAADYIVKPFRARELLVRIHATLHSTRGRIATIMLRDIEIDPTSAQVRKRGEDLALSALEYRLLLIFAQNPGSLISRERIRNALWDSAGEFVSDNAISVYIKRLRERVEDVPARPELIVTVRGLGYRAEA